MTTATSSGSGGGSRKRPLHQSSSSVAAAAADGGAGGDGSAGPTTGVATLLAGANNPISHDAPDVFERLLSPLTVEDFLKLHYGPKRPLVVRGHDFEPLVEEGMEGGDAAALLEVTPSESISVWTVERGASRGRISTARIQEAASAAALWRAGHSVYCRAPEPVERALVDAAVRSLGLGFRTAEDGVRAVVEGEVELFLGRQGHRTPWHFDFQENWTLQLRGLKRWRLLPGVANPVRGCTPHYTQAEGVLDPAAEEQLKVHRLRDPRFRYGPPLGRDEEAVEVVLEAGDFLYHPAGVWHQVECVGEEDSVSINISLDGLTYADHIAGALRQALMAQRQFTALVHTGGPPERSLSQMAGLLREAARHLEGLAATPEALLPPCTLWGQPLAPLEPAEGDGGDGEGMMEMEEEDEEEGGAGSGDDDDDDDDDDASDKEEEEEEEEEETEQEEDETDMGASFPHPIEPRAVLRRNPLATLFALDDTDPDDDGGAEEGAEVEAFMVHFAYGAGEDLASVLRKKVGLDARLGRFVGQQPLAQPFTPAQVPGGGAREGLRALGLLVHLGVLLLLEKEEGKEHQQAGAQAKKKKGRK